MFHKAQRILMQISLILAGFPNTAEAATPVSKYTYYTIAEQQAFVRDFIAHKRLKSQEKIKDLPQFQEFVDNGAISFKTGTTPQRVQFTKAMIDYLRNLDAQNVQLEGLFVYEGGATPDNGHTRRGEWGNPADPSWYFNHAVDIFKFGGQRISPFQADTTVAAVVSAIESLPPGTYELGLPREAYPNFATDKKGNWGKDIKTYFQSKYPGYRADLKVKKEGDENTYINEQVYKDMRRFMPWYTNEVLNKARPELAEDMKWMTDADRAALQKALDTSNYPEIVRYIVRDRSYGHRIADAMKQVMKNGVRFDGIYGDALDHFHITVTSVTSVPAAPAPQGTPAVEDQPQDPLMVPDMSGGHSPIDDLVQPILNDAIGYLQYNENDLKNTMGVGGDRIEMLPGDRVRIKNPAGGIQYEGSKADWLQFLNDQEKRLTDQGYSLRQKAEDGLGLVTSEIPTDVDSLRSQLLNELRLNAPSVLQKVGNPLPQSQCPTFDASAMSQPLLGARVPLADVDGLTFGDFLDRVNDIQSVFCALGYSLLDQDIVERAKDIQIPQLPTVESVARPVARMLATPRSFTEPSSAANNAMDTFVREVMSKRDGLLQDMGLSSLAKGLNIDAFRKLGNFGDIAKDVEDILSGKTKVGPEMLNDLKDKLGVKELDDLKIPSMPDFPMPGKPTRTPLNVKKMKRWDGLNMGKRDILGMEGFAQLEMGGTEESQTFRADAQSNMYVFGKDFSILDALGELYIGPDKAKVHLHTKVVGFDLFKPVEESGKIKIVIEKPNAFSFNKKVGYSQTFAIGPIPVSVAAGGFINLGLGYRLGVVTTQVEGGVTPHADIGGYAEAAIGFSGIVSAGAGAEITVLSLNAPITGGAKLLFDGEGYPFLRIFIDTDASLELLNGRVYAYVEFPVPFEIKKETMTIFRFQGPHFNHKIMSWSIDIGHQGAKVAGDILDQNDREEAATIQQAISLDNRKEELEQYRTRLKNFADQAFNKVLNDAASPENTQLRDLANDLERSKDTLVGKNGELMNGLKNL